MWVCVAALLLLTGHDGEGEGQDSKVSGVVLIFPAGRGANPKRRFVAAAIIGHKLGPAALEQDDGSSSSLLQASFKWEVDGFSSLLERGGGGHTPTYSNVFRMRGLYWYLKLNPRDTTSDDQNEHVSLRLELDKKSVRSNRVVKTTFKLLIYDQLYGKHHELQVSHDFQSKSTSSGTAWLIPLAELEKNSSRFLANDSCVFCVKLVSVVIAKAEDVSETLFVRKMKHSGPQVYTWNIEDFFALQNPSYSPEFELCGHKWSIKIYPSGDDTTGDYLSLYLVMNVPDTLHEKSARLIEKVITIKNPGTGKRMLKAKGRSEYSKDYDSWGWGKFISLENFKDPSNAYLVKAKCCIEVQVAVIGSSRMK
uniref:Uncharacterized protein n=1 Tax=Avena sativa TaxID=4498 RepID=A0ACD5Y0S3_AVESA